MQHSLGKASGSLMFGGKSGPIEKEGGKVGEKTCIFHNLVSGRKWWVSSVFHQKPISPIWRENTKDMGA